MPTLLGKRLEALDADDACGAFSRIRRGIEKESLRVQPSGDLAQTPHPRGLGSALTHAHITTDFCEAQPELITGVHESINDCLTELSDIHSYVYRNLNDELLWSASMPCMLGQDDQVPVGRYGSSNIGRAKTIYRLGLGYRYGRLMQTISGIHYNFSLPDALWPVIARREDAVPDQDYRTRAYFALIRNFRRHSWLLLYLFGASPAICKSFVKDKPHNLQSFDEGTLYSPYATSLRMGGLGYQSDAQAQLHVSYNSLAQYTATLREALTRPYPPYEAIGVKVDGGYRQLSSTLLQIENEFYGTIRPKRPVQHGERPLSALQARGVEYVEVRCMDLNPFLPLGIDIETIRFLDTFLLHCLWSESPPDTEAESLEMRANQRRVVEAGREPGLALTRQGESVPMKTWAQRLLDECQPVAERLDRCHGQHNYVESVARQRARIDDPARTPSAQVLDHMQRERIPFFRFAMNQSLAHKRYFQAHPLTPERLAYFEQESANSIAAQAALEAADAQPFDDFLRDYLKLPDPPTP
jgi:glutamate--cysteine ligase